MNQELRIEPLCVEHLDFVMQWVNDPDVTFYFADLGRKITREEEARYLVSLIDSKSDIIYSLFEEETYVGQIGISKIYWPAKNGRIGMMLCKAAWGRGLGMEAARLIIDASFRVHGLHKLWVIIRSDNAKGLHMWDKLGFRREGLLREEYFVNDGYHDMVRYGLLETDYLDNHSTEQ
jgi:diamine N-acetyltransferase